MNRCISLCILLWMISLSSCEESEVFTLSGDLFGRIGAIMDEFGKLLEDRSGYLVEVEGAAPEKSAVTDFSGKFFIEDLTAGTYNLIFSKPGFQTLKVFSYQFTGGNVPTYYEAPLLSQLSSTSVKNFKAFVTSENNPDTAKYTVVKFEFEIYPVTTPDQPRTAITYISTSDKVSGTDYQFQLNDPGFYKFNKWARGTKLYAVAYPAPTACNAYYDPERNQFINSCLGEPTNIVEFEVP